MPTKRRRIGRKIGMHITPEAVAAYVAGDLRALHVALRWPPWLPSPRDVDPGEPPAWIPADRWARAQEVQAAIEAELTPAQRRYAVCSGTGG